MDRNLVLLNQNIARLRRDVRLQTSEIEQLIAADIDRASAARRLMRMQRAGWLERPVRRTSMSDCVRRSSQSEGGYPSIAFYGDDGFVFAQPILPAKHDNGQTRGRLDGRVPHFIFSDCFEKCALLISESASNHALFVALPLRLGVSSVGN